MTLDFILNGVLAVLLIATIAYCVRLNRRLGALGEAHAEMKVLIKGFGKATERAQAGLGELKEVAVETGAELQNHLEQARAANDELAFLIRSGTSLADRLDTDLANATVKPDDAPTTNISAFPRRHDAAIGGDLTSEAERELIKSLRGKR